MAITVGEVEYIVSFTVNQASLAAARAAANGLGGNTGAGSGGNVTPSATNVSPGATLSQGGGQPPAPGSPSAASPPPYQPYTAVGGGGAGGGAGGGGAGGGGAGGGAGGGGAGTGGGGGGGEVPGAPPSASRRGDMFGARFAALLAIHSAVGTYEAMGRGSMNSALAGTNQALQLKADLQQRQEMGGLAFGLVGALGDLREDSNFGLRTRIGSAQQTADALDEKTKGMSALPNMRRSMSNAAALAGVEGTARDRLEAQQRYDTNTAKANAQEREAAERDNAVIEQHRISKKNDFEERFKKKYPDGTDPYAEGNRALLQKEDDDAIAEERRSTAAARKRDFDSITTDADRLLKFDTRAANFKDKLRGEGLTADEYATSLQAKGRPLASRAGLILEDAKEKAEADTFEGGEKAKEFAKKDLEIGRNKLLTLQRGILERINGDGNGGQGNPFGGVQTTNSLTESMQAALQETNQKLDDINTSLRGL